MPTQELALLADELARQQIAVQAVGADLDDVVHGVMAVGSAPVIERVAEMVADAADDLTDLWFVDADAFVTSEAPDAVDYDDYDDEPVATSTGQLRFVLITACLMLAVAACVGATV